MYTKLLGAFLLSAVLFSCQHEAGKEQTTDSRIAEPVTATAGTETDKEIPVPGNMQAADTISSDQPPTPRQNNQPAQAPTVIKTDWNKKIIKSATLKLEVKDFKGYNDYLYLQVNRNGGYIAQETSNGGGDRSETMLTIKVPVQYFEALMKDLAHTDATIVEKTIQSQDVTGEVVDTRARLEAKKQMRLKYLEFLRQSKNMGEVLQVQNEINNLQEEIEAASGRFASLSTQSAYSTIQLTFYQLNSGFKPSGEAPSFFSKTREAFKTGMDWLASLFLALMTIWPLLLAGFGVVLFYKKRKAAVYVKQNN